MKGSDDLQVQDILAKDLVGDECLTEDELRFLMSVTDAEARKRGEQTGLDTLVVHAVNDEC